MRLGVRDIVQFSIFNPGQTVHRMPNLLEMPSVEDLGVDNHVRRCIDHVTWYSSGLELILRRERVQRRRPGRDRVVDLSDAIASLLDSQLG